MSRLEKIAERPDDLLALEPEELALLVLQDIIEEEKRPTAPRPNRKNFSGRFESRDERVQRAIMEAWGWLESAGAIAQRPLVEEGNFFVTRRGHQLAQSSETAVFTRAQTLPRHLLHPVIEQKTWSAYLRGDYDLAVFAAFKQVEVAIRTAGGFSDAEVGVALARRAFDPNRGRLTDKTRVPAEREALSHLVAGALGSYKNPLSHRNVAIADASEAAEMIILASHLLKIIEARNRN